MRALRRALGLCLCASLTLPAAAKVQRLRTPPVVPPKARWFDLRDVHLLAGPFRRAMEIDEAYLLRLDPDRLLSHLRRNAGLSPKAPPYGGWDERGAGTVGHYLSACAQMTQATGDPEVRKRVDYVVAEMAACQRARGDGGLYAFAYDANVWFPKLTEGELIPVPVTAWYVAHKIMAGLRDAWLLCGNPTARDTLLRMADWCVAVTAKLTDAQWQQMLAGEHGAPHEILADVYAMTGNRKYLDCAQRFRHHLVFDPLARGDDSVLNGLHANTQIPKFVGYERIYELTGDKLWHDAARNFWENVVARRSWVNGGNSQWEAFFAPEAFPDKVTEICGPETCNTYNLLKLTRQLYALEPSARFMDTVERALYNHILPSEAPDGGGFVYYTPMRPGHYRVFSRPFDAFWCCVGTGMENHARYGEMIYAHDGDNRLFVNLFIPSELEWKTAGITLRQETTFPDEPKTQLRFTLAEAQRMTISVRYPGWVAPGALKIRVNGTAIPVSARPGSFADITRTWRTGDRIEVALPMRVTAERLPNSRDTAAFLCGPILLAGALGTQGLTHDDFFGGGEQSAGGQLARKSLPLDQTPLFVGTPEQAAARIVRVPGKQLAFRTRDLAKPNDVTLVPFYRLYLQRYALYWRMATPESYAQIGREERERRARVADEIIAGDWRSEDAHALEGRKTNTGDGPDNRKWRDAGDGGWFSFTMKVLPGATAQDLVCTYWGGETGNRTFDIQIDGRTIATETLDRNRPGQYFEKTYPIPPEVLAGKQRVIVRFQARPGGIAGGLYSCRIERRVTG